MKSRYQNPQSGKSIEWLVQPKRVCQTWFLLLSYLRYKWSRGEETGLISDKTSNPCASYVEKSIADFERGLTTRADTPQTPTGRARSDAAAENGVNPVCKHNPPVLTLSGGSVNKV